jgi:aminoglycoside phosphotransferase (APT) family kinase protein
MTLPGDLFPPMAVLGEARAIVERLARDGTLGASDAAALRQAGTGVTLRLDELAPPMQPVHGDAHLGNVIHTTAGPLWNDWEDTFTGPREWDLACLEASARIFGSDPAAVAEARAGHGEEADAEVLALLLEARRFQGTVWMVLSARGRPEMRSRAADLLARFPRAS